MVNRRDGRNPGCRRRLARKDGGPVVLDTHHGPPIGLSSTEGLLGPNLVVELPLCVVMQEEEPQGWPVGVVGELKHGGVPVRVSRCEQRASSDSVPDPDRLFRAVVEVVGLGLVGDGAAMVVAGVGEGAAASDDSLAVMPYMSWLMGRMKSRPPPEAM